MSRSRPPPLVTGISPNEGIPWTKVTIRGENLGTGTPDLIGLTICGHNCLLTAEWMSASKIVCRVGQAKNDKGDIIVTTKSGGRGTSTVSFKLLKPEKIGVLDQSAVWVDEMNHYDMRTGRNKGIPPLSLRPANPLGIEIEKGQFPQKDLEVLFPGMSADFTSENLSAAWYLIENHSNTSFEQLKMAVAHLKRQANKKSEGSLAYVKGGLSTFFEAQDALSAIHQKLEADGTEKVEGSMTQKLENVLNRASNTADTLFQEVLGRKDKADSTRNALTVLQRFKFLFNLPLNIERNIQKGDYDVVINDYEKAKSLFGKTEVQVFKKYYAEVETRIEALRELLLDKLLETPSTLHDQKRYIRYLSDLRAPGDPAWQCIGAQHRWILQLMHDCREGCARDLTGTPGLHSAVSDPDSDARPPALGHLGHTASLKRGSGFQSGRGDAWRYKTPQRVAFVEKLTKLVLSQLPNFWKLWISYVNGSLFSETAEKSGHIERSKNVRQRQSDFKKMIQEVMHCLVKLIRGALLPPSAAEGGVRPGTGREVKAELSGQWLAHVIQTLRLTYESLTALEIPSDLLQTIQDLVLDLRGRCVAVTLQHTAEEIKRLAEKEDWIVDSEGLTSLVSMASLKELDQRLFENYIELKADPIVGSLEPGIYAGYFDWKDCLPPTGVRNYLKEALVSIIAVHAEVFAVCKGLVPRVLSRVVEAVSEELSRLMQCVSSFSRNGALQARLEICALRDILAAHLTPESRSSFKQALEALPQLSSGAERTLLEELLNRVKGSMHLQLACFQAAPPPTVKT
ncbi:exocyst complex component 2 isoform X5 [Phacochoerus africanus]|uniref:exocyst complex component 2 isoform X5 n=1 Tax=Phacochoerus africanus TaxID=41426 RepID=UPI001FD87E9F|nr:exocyst complex component 2 isoform X5 [Phacochoerus africanus]